MSDNAIWFTERTEAQCEQCGASSSEKRLVSFRGGFPSVSTWTCADCLKAALDCLSLDVSAYKLKSTDTPSWVMERTTLLRWAEETRKENA